MKKIIYTLLVAVMALSFMGCPTVYEDLKPQVDLTPFYLRGNMNNWCNDAITDGALTKNDDGSFSITYTAKAEPDEFAIADKGWGVKYCNGTEIVVGADFVELGSGGDNAKVTGQVPGNNYKMTILPLEASVKVKVELAGVNVPSLYVIDTTPVKMEYDGTQYKYTAKATSDTIKLPVWVNDTYLKGTYALGAENAADLTIEDKVSTVDITGVTSGSEYLVYITYDEETEKATVKAERALPKVYLAGEAPFAWDLGGGTAVQAYIVGATSWYYYTFEAKATTLNFKVALKDAWSDAYSNNTEEDGKVKTELDKAPIEYANANAKNAQITGLEVGKKYTLLINIASGKPAVSVITGEDILFAIGNDDFGVWNWDSCKTMTPAGAGEWEYEFKATKADAQFKFQTKCGNWNDAATWNAKAALTLGGEYVDMSNGAGDPNTSATLEVGKTYVLSVKKSGEKYQVKIAEK